MADSSPQDFQTVLGPDANIKGEVTFDKAMRVHGRVEGKIISSGRLHVAKEARLTADIEAGSIIVEGEIKGNLTATDRVELKNSARYEGDLRAGKLVVEEGASFSGHVSVGPEAVKAGAAKPQVQVAVNRQATGAAAGAAPQPVRAG
jgi:cytoskeletal protein CcmA (bactofilin family)